MKRRASRRAARRGRILPRRGVRASRVCASFSRDALVSVNGEAVAEYAYDALGNLVAAANGEEAFEVLVEDGHPLADVAVASDGTKTPLRVYMRGPGVDNWLGFVDMTGATPVPYFYVTDHLGSVLAVVDAGGNVVERYEYDAWGKVLSVTDANGQQLLRSAIGNRILWQGREYSWTTGLYYFRNRWYDPTIGRWISKDPIGINGGVNLYEFCGGNGVNKEDPLGLRFVTPIITPIFLVGPGLGPHWHHAGREARNAPLPKYGTISDGKDGWRLMPKEQSVFHDNGDECPEEKWVNKDGREVVYDGKTHEIITDARFKGTFNYVDPPKNLIPRNLDDALRWLGHAFADVIPYLFWDN